MRPHQIFGAMSESLAERVLETLRQESPAVYTQSVAITAGAMKARPRFLMKQPHKKRASMIRRALARVGASPLAEEALATFFLETQRELLIEWLDAVGIEHEEGTLKDDAPASPGADALAGAVESFRKGEDPEIRELLLQAFAAQNAIDWPELDALVSVESD
ncbi:MAG: hypothetical protein QNK05_10335 [Myxococcota bacterium]|nr:hypothetical protein [Myxococcota bacterium]